MEKNHYENPDAVRNAIPSHNLFLVSLPREISLRAGIQRGVQVRVDQDPKKPELVTLEVINPADTKSELKDYLAKRKALTDKRAAKAKRKAAAKKKAEKLAEKKANAAKVSEPREPEEAATAEQAKPE